MSSKEEAERALAYVEERTRFDSSISPTCFDTIRSRLVELKAELARMEAHNHAWAERYGELEKKNEELRVANQVDFDRRDREMSELEAFKARVLVAVRAAYEHLDRFGDVKGHADLLTSQEAVFNLLRPFVHAVPVEPEQDKESPVNQSELLDLTPFTWLHDRARRVKDEERPSAQLDRIRELESLLKGHNLFIAELQESNAQLEAFKAKVLPFLRSIRDGWDCDRDAHRYDTPCRCCAAEALLAEDKKAP